MALASHRMSSGSNTAGTAATGITSIISGRDRMPAPPAKPDLLMPWIMIAAPTKTQKRVAGTPGNMKGSNMHGYTL